MTNLTHIFGCPRSGTTWLWSLLEEHPDITPFVFQSPIEHKYSTSESGVYINNINNAKQLLTEYCKKHKYVIEKTPSNTTIYNRIVNIFPDSDNILLVRHPISIYKSIRDSKVPGLPTQKEKIANLVKRYYSFYPTISKNSLVVCYEQMKQDTQLVMNTIYDYLNLDKIEYTNFNVQSKVNLSHVFRKGEIYKEGSELELEELFKKEILDWINYENISRTISHE